jgi:hypothetical protein
VAPSAVAFYLATGTMFAALLACVFVDDLFIYAVSFGCYFELLLRICSLLVHSRSVRICVIVVFRRCENLVSLASQTGNKLCYHLRNSPPLQLFRLSFAWKTSRCRRWSFRPYFVIRHHLLGGIYTGHCFLLSPSFSLSLSHTHTLSLLPSFLPSLTTGCFN